MNKDRLKTFTAVVGTVIGLTGIAITIVNFLRERPRIEIHVDSTGLPSIERSEIQGHLHRVEAVAGAVTGSLMADLLRRTDSITDSTDVERLRELRGAVQKRIEHFDEGLTWPPEDIVVEGTTVTWPDDSSIDVTTRNGEASFPAELVAAMRAGPVPPEVEREIRQRAHRMHSGIDTDQARQLALRAAEELRNLRIKLDEVIDEDRRRLVARLTVSNRSALPSYVVANAAVTIAQSGGEPRTIVLRLVGDGLLERYSVRSLELESRTLSSLDQLDRDIIDEALQSADGLECVVLLTDLHGRYWPGRGRISSRQRTADKDDFHRRGLELIAAGSR